MKNYKFAKKTIFVLSTTITQRKSNLENIIYRNPRTGMSLVDAIKIAQLGRLPGQGTTVSQYFSDIDTNKLS
jgi:hypothetical protein